VLADRWKVGEQIADGVWFSDGAPGEVGGWVCHDRDDAVLIASGPVRNGFRDDWRELLKSMVVGAGGSPPNVGFADGLVMGM
jgi:hypothetical protein